MQARKVMFVSGIGRRGNVYQVTVPKDAITAISPDGGEVFQITIECIPQREG